MRVLVTGGAGFIGSHVVDGLLTAGHEVAVIDNLSTGNRANLNPSAAFHEVDVRDVEGVARVFAGFRPEVVDHHAAQSEVPRSVTDPVFDADVNLVGGVNLLRASVDAGVRKFVFISTGGALYGEPDQVPCDEDHPVRPLSPYGTSKHCFEAYLGTFQRTFGLDHTVLRYANVYGPRQDFAAEEGRVVAIFASRMLAGRDVTIDGDGEQARDLLHVADAVAANLAVLERGSGRAYHVGTGIPVTVNHVFGLLSRLTGYGRPPLHGPGRRGDVRRIALDSSRAARELGWHPEMDLEAGLRTTVDHFREALASGRG